MKKERFSVINDSKFESLSDQDLMETKGGLCISCMKRSRKIPWNPTIEIKLEISK